MSIENDDHLIKLRVELLTTLSGYVRAMRDDSSWIHYYITNLKLKPPTFLFSERKEQFESKLDLLLDVMELAHLYCKVSNPKDYNSGEHVKHKITHTFIMCYFAQLDENQFYELRQYLKSNVMFGAS